MIVGYFDGSEEPEGIREIIAVCGFIAPLEVWDVFDQRWQAVLSRPTWPTRLRRYHSFDCIHGMGEFADWSFAQRLAIYGELVGVLLDSNLIAVGSVLVCKHFETLEAVVRNRLGNAYFLPVEHCIQAAISKAKGSLPGEEIFLVFDVENRAVANESYARYKNYQTDPNWNENLLGITQGSSYQFTSLQAADLLAYGSFRYHKEYFAPSERESEFPIIPAFSRLIQGIEATGGIYERDALATLVREIRAREGI